MKLRLNKNTQRVQKRFKWLCLACFSIFALYYVVENGISSVQEHQFVEAGEDKTFEQDQIYSDYIRSATFQKELMTKQKRNGHKTWTLDHYRQFKIRRMQSMLVEADVEARMTKMKGGVAGWEEGLKNFDSLQDITHDKTTTKDGKEIKIWTYKDQEFEGYALDKQAQGYIEEYWGEERCFSGMINTPGVSLLPVPLMGFAYFMFLGYLFLGISISADIFMEAIDVITSQVMLVSTEPDEEGKSYQIEVPVWNPTMANLSLMAFGSSAPEIILSVLEALKDLGKPSGDLGPSTIVGSAAFNLLIISAVSIIAVGEGDNSVKKIDMMGVFLTTSFFSIFAYVWLFLCLSVNTPGQVTVEEASWTFSFFFILLCLAFCTDKYAQIQQKKRQGKLEKEELVKKNKRAQLRAISKQKGVQAVLNAAQGQKHEKIKENELAHINQLYMDVLGVDDIKKVDLDTLMSVLQPDSLFERFAARKAAGMGTTKEFLDVKGQKFQIENDGTNEILVENENFAFKCLHYSVSESAGTVKVTITKKTDKHDTLDVGIRTKDGSAYSEARFDEQEGREVPASYDHLDQIITMMKMETDRVVEFTIHDNSDWQPDMDFSIELYDPNTSARLHGDDTECKITILDEDFPGMLQFDNTDIQASKNHDQVNIIVKRIEGSDGIISCTLRTEPYLPNDEANPQNAIKYEDYLPKQDLKVEFVHGEVEKIVPIFLVNERVPKVGDTNDEGANSALQEDEDEEEEEEVGPKFKVFIYNPQPEKQVKISKKNCCTVEILSSSGGDTTTEHTNLISYFLEQKNPSWSYKFKKAVMLCPQVNEDDMIVEDVSLMEALTHFAIIGWNLLFAFIPPVEWGGGIPAFMIALTFIGSITAIVAEVATVLGCTLGLKAAVTAITLVAVGTSLPDTSASMIAAKQSEFADSAIGNVTGSNSVNVFVGLGLPWLISSIYQHKRGEIYETPPGNLAFSVMLFLITSVTCFFILGLRRATLGGELGGPPGVKYISAIILVCLWLIYVVFSSLKAYNVITWNPTF